MKTLGACPGCHDLLTTNQTGLKFNEDGDRVLYVCPHCEAEIDAFLFTKTIGGYERLSGKPPADLTVPW